VNKIQLTTILQATLFAFDGAKQEEIIDLNPDCDINLVKTGIKLLEFLKEKIE